MKASVIIVGIISSLLLWTCGDIGSKQTKSEKQIMEEGRAITKAVGSTLIKTVQQKMAAGGIEAAVGYCNINALAITDSVAKAHGVSVKRTALKTRNPKNNPTQLEKDALLKMSAQTDPQAKVVYDENDNAVYFQPIVLQGFCQTCHGTVGESLTVPTNKLIKYNYPYDQATGFSTGDLRGMWAVYF